MDPADETNWIADLPAETATHVRQLLGLPDFPRRLARFSGVLSKVKSADPRTVARLAEEARRLAPDDAAVRRDTDWYFAKMIPRWHYRIINDPVRNEVYRRAIERWVKPGMIVYEIGTGTGILSMLAARAGAKHVYTCERKPLLAEAARENIRRNGFADRITVLGKDSRNVSVGEDLPERADLMVCEIVNNGLLGEFALDLTADALARLLKPQAILLPDQIELRAALAGGEEWATNARTAPACGLDVSAVDWLGPAITEAPPGLDPQLSDDVALLHFDLSQSADYQPEKKEVAITVRESGLAQGIVHWIWLRFGPGIELDNRPPKPSCWSPKLHLFPHARQVLTEDQVQIAVAHDRRNVEITA